MRAKSQWGRLAIGATAWLTWGSLLAGTLLAPGCAAPEETYRRRTQYYVSDRIRASTTEIESNTSTETITPGIEGSQACTHEQGQLFGPKNPWNQAIDKEPLARDSVAVIRYLAEHHTSKQRFRTDFSFVVLEATPSTERRAFTPNEDHYLPDCDVSPMPIVPSGRIEGEAGYACTKGGDCHLLVHVPEECKLYEMWRTNLTDKGFFGGCLAVWNTSMNYGTTGRGDQCTSADAAGLPITPLLFSAEDLAAGEIRHAIRLILPNKLIRNRMYVPPATHSTGATKGPDAAPPYGGRFRLRVDVDITRLSRGAQVVAQALKRYGMIIVDGGQVSFTATSDQGRAISWASQGFDALSLETLRWEDFELVDAGLPKRWKGDCRRTPLR